VRGNGERIPTAAAGAALSHMDVGVRELRNDTARVIDALRAGERVTLTVRGFAPSGSDPSGRNRSQAFDSKVRPLVSLTNFSTTNSEMTAIAAYPA